MPQKKKKKKGGLASSKQFKLNDQKKAKNLVTIQLYKYSFSPAKIKSTVLQFPTACKQSGPA